MNTRCALAWRGPHQHVFVLDPRNVVLSIGGLQLVDEPVDATDESLRQLVADARAEYGAGDDVPDRVVLAAHVIATVRARSHVAGGTEPQTLTIARAVVAALDAFGAREASPAGDSPT